MSLLLRLAYTTSPRRLWSLKPNTHRRRQCRRDATDELRRVGGVNTIRN